MLWTAPPPGMSAMDVGVVLLLEICAVREAVLGP